MEKLPDSVVEKFKRMGVTLLTIALVALNKKLGLDFGPEEIAGIATLAVGYVVSGSWKAARVKEAETAGKTAAAEVDTLSEAMDVVKDTIGSVK